MLRLLVAATLIFVAHCAPNVCPPGFQIMGDGRCIKPVNLWEGGRLDAILQPARDVCAEEGASLPIIRSAQENAMFIDIVKSFDQIKDSSVFLVLDMVCNEKTQRLEWSDGTAITYQPTAPKIDLIFNCDQTMKDVVLRTWFNDWFFVEPDATIYTYTLLCVTESTGPLDASCGEYERMDKSDDADKPCFKIYNTSKSWTDAEAKCAEDFGTLATIHSQEENTYFRRTATSMLITGGMHIGAEQSPTDADTWQWVDGDVVIGKKVYDNFIDPLIPGGGTRSAMVTSNVNGVWFNVDADAELLPFLCRRVGYPAPSKTCPSASPPEGTDIFPPGFPSSTIPCEYLLVAAQAGKLIQLEVLGLEATPEVDYLRLYEGLSGTPFQNLTGIINKKKTFTTAKSNIMRVSWEPAATSAVRGFRMQYTEIDPPAATKTTTPQTTTLETTTPPPDNVDTSTSEASN